MSQTILGIIVMLASVLLPKIGLNIGSDQLTSTISTIVLIVAAAWAWYARHRLGGINVAGIRTN